MESGDYTGLVCGSTMKDQLIFIIRSDHGYTPDEGIEYEALVDNANIPLLKLDKSLNA